MKSRDIFSGLESSAQRWHGTGCRTIRWGVFLFAVWGQLQAQDPATDLSAPLIGRPLLSQKISTIPCAGYDFPVATVLDLAVAVDAQQRLHLLWTGKLEDYFDYFLFYSFSTNGRDWSPCQILDYWNTFEPKIVSDSARNRIHILYRNETGILHRIVQSGVMSDAGLIDLGNAPKIALEESTGRLHCIWHEGYFYDVSSTVRQWRYRTFFSTWTETGWAARRQVVTNEDTAGATVAGSGTSQVMLAWFQDFGASQPKDNSDPGIPTFPRSAFSQDSGLHFPARVAVTDGNGYPYPETIFNFVLGYSAADGKFHLMGMHAKAPGHSVVDHFVWDGVGAWSNPENMSNNTSRWAYPLYVGSPRNSKKTLFLWSVEGQGWQLGLRDRQGGWELRPLGQQIVNQGYSITNSAWDVDGTFIHLVLAGTQNGQPGVYYLQIPIGGGKEVIYLPLILK